MMCLFLRHHLASPVVVVVVVVGAAYAADADQKLVDDLKKIPFYLLEILFQNGAPFCLKGCSHLILSQCFPLLTWNFPVSAN